MSSLSLFHSFFILINQFQPPSSFPTFHQNNLKAPINIIFIIDNVVIVLYSPLIYQPTIQPVHSDVYESPWNIFIISLFIVVFLFCPHNELSHSHKTNLLFTSIEGHNFHTFLTRLCYFMTRTGETTTKKKQLRFTSYEPQITIWKTQQFQRYIQENKRLFVGFPVFAIGSFVTIKKRQKRINVDARTMEWK